MKPLALLPFSLLLLTAPAVSADLDRPIYREREVEIERPRPHVVERERIIEHHHHHYGPPVVAEKRIYVEPPRIHEPRDYVYYDRPYRYRAYIERPHFYAPRRAFWHRHRHHRHW